MQGFDWTDGSKILSKLYRLSFVLRLYNLFLNENLAPTNQIKHIQNKFLQTFFKQIMEKKI